MAEMFGVSGNEDQILRGFNCVLLVCIRRFPLFVVELQLQYCSEARQLSVGHSASWVASPPCMAMIESWAVPVVVFGWSRVVPGGVRSVDSGDPQKRQSRVGPPCWLIPWVRDSGQPRVDLLFHCMGRPILGSVASTISRGAPSRR